MQNNKVTQELLAGQYMRLAGRARQAASAAFGRRGLPAPQGVSDEAVAEARKWLVDKGYKVVKVQALPMVVQLVRGWARRRQQLEACPSFAIARLVSSFLKGCRDEVFIAPARRLSPTRGSGMWHSPPVGGTVVFRAKKTSRLQEKIDLEVMTRFLSVCSTDSED